MKRNKKSKNFSLNKRRVILEKEGILLKKINIKTTFLKFCERNFIYWDKSSISYTMGNTFELFI
jgi:hypothetical protein